MIHCFKKTVILLMILIGVIFIIPQTTLNYDMDSSKKMKKSIPRKTFFPKLLVDCNRGDIDEHYSLYNPLGIVTDSKGNIYILDCRNNRIIKYDRNLNFIKTAGEKGRGPGQFGGSLGLGRSDIAIEGDILYLIDGKNMRVNIYSEDLKFLRSFPPSMVEYFTIAVDKQANIYLSKNPLHQTGFGDQFTIHKYKKTSDSYKFERGFSDCIIWMPQNSLSTSENIRILNLSRSIVRIGPDNAVYQLFYQLPIIRKFNPDGKLIYQKIIDHNVLREDGWREKDLAMLPNIKRYNAKEIQSMKRRITFRDFCVNTKTNTFMLLMTSNKILELDLDCNPLRLLIPDEKSSNLSLSNDDEYCSNLLNGNFSFTYNFNSNQFLFLGWNSGEIWAADY